MKPALQHMTPNFRGIRFRDFLTAQIHKIIKP